MTSPEKPSKQNEKQAKGVSRRDMLLGMGAAATMAYAGTASAKKSMHDHSKHTAQKPEVLNAANMCVDKAQRCIAHCLVSFQEGSTELAVCASKVHEMQEVCSAFSYLLSANSTYNKEFSRISKKVCEDCADECRKHDKHHECRACAEACEDLVDAIAMHIT